MTPSKSTTRRSPTPRETKHHPIADRIAASMSRLTPSEATIAHYFADHGDDVLFMSAVEIGRALGVGTATVVRAAQALGYSGLPELKKTLRDTMRRRGTLNSSVDLGLEELGSDAAASFSQTLTFHQNVLSKARQSVEPAEINRAVQFIATADRIAVLGFGMFPELAHDFMAKLRRHGRNALDIRGRGDAMTDDLMELRRGDTAVVLAYARLSSELAVVLQVIQERGARCVLISDALAVALKGPTVAVLTADRGRGSLHSSIVALALLEALLFSLLGYDRARTEKAVDQSSELRARLLASRRERRP